MLQLRPNCECCDKDLAPNPPGSRMFFGLTAATNKLLASRAPR